VPWYRMRSSIASSYDCLDPRLRVNPPQPRLTAVRRRIDEDAGTGRWRQPKFASQLRDGTDQTAALKPIAEQDVTIRNHWTAVTPAALEPAAQTGFSRTHIATARKMRSGAETTR
jgi:hypothetical protein